MNATNVTGSGISAKRIVVLDGETISTDPNDPRGALGSGSKDGAAPGEKSQIVCLGTLIECGDELRPVMIADRDERVVLRKFWDTVRADDLLVGHNLREFDIVRIKQRSWILGVAPSFDPQLAKYRETNVYDTMEQWTNWGRPDGATLDNLARVLGVGRKSGNGAQVEEWWREGEYAKVMDYCMQDVYLTYLVFCRMKFRQALPLPMLASDSMGSPLARDAGIPVDGFRPAPFRDPNVRPTPISELRAQSREPVPVPAARPASASFSRDALPASGTQYRFVSDGNGGLTPLPVESPYSGAAVSGAGNGSAGVERGSSFSPTPQTRANAPAPADSSFGRGPLPGPLSSPDAPANGAGRSYPARGRSGSSSTAPNRSRKRVYYVDTGVALQLTGGTYPIKDDLKALGARVLRDQAQDKVIGWTIEPGKFDALAGLCARAGITLAQQPSSSAPVAGTRESAA